MDNKQKRWLLLGPVVFSFAVAMTSSVIQIYFMQLIDSSVLAISNMLAGGLIILVLGTMNIEIAIAIECIANLFMGLTDLRARKLLMQKEGFHV